MTTPKVELSEALLFRPGHIGDPPPWLLQYLGKEQIIQAARIQIEFQLEVQKAYTKALQQLEGVLK